MSRLLDEDDVVDWLLKRTEMYDATGHFVDENVVKKNIESQIAKIPSAQPEIIRCKDCAKREYCRTSTVWAVPPGDDWFCADAERREE